MTLVITPTRRGLRVTDRDVRLLSFLMRYRHATTQQIAAYLEASPKALANRLPRLRDHKLLASESIPHVPDVVWRATATGAVISDVDLTTPGPISWVTAMHTLGLVDIGSRFEVRGEVTVTEREIRAIETRGGANEPRDLRHVVRVGSRSIHVPDLVLAREPYPDGTPRSVAVELELNRKTLETWRTILRAYRDAPTIAGVLYYTHRRDIRDGVLRAAREVGADHLIEVRRYAPPAGTLR